MTLDAPTREGLTIATKFTPIAPTEGIIRRQVEGSARRLGVGAIDLLYAHWPNPFVSVRRTMQSLRPLVDEGLVRRAAVATTRSPSGRRPSGRCGTRSTPTRCRSRS